MSLQSPGHTIVVDYDLPRPPRTVWRALTEPALLEAWLMKNDIAPVVGHRFTLQARPMPGWDGIVHAEVLEVEPERRLSYSWCGGSAGAGAGTGQPAASFRLDTVVTWTLVANGTGGTRLRLEHSGFTPENGFAFQRLETGWRGRVGERLGQVVAGLE